MRLRATFSKTKKYVLIQNVHNSGVLYYPYRVNSCADLCVPDTTSCVRGAHVTDPISICRKRVGLTAGGMETQKHCSHKNKISWVSPHYGCSLSARKEALIFRALYLDKRVN